MITCRSRFRKPVVSTDPLDGAQSGLARKPTDPVAGSPPIVRNRNHLHSIGEFYVDQVVREAPNPYPPDARISNSGRWRSDLRVLLDPAYRSIDRREKLLAQATPMQFVPASGVGHLGLRVLTDPKR